MKKLLIMAFESERKRIARDIHDGPAQKLINIMHSIELIEDFIKNDKKSDSIKELHQTLKFTKTTLKELRNIMFNLQPPMLEKYGLDTNLKSFVHELEKLYTNIKFNIVIDNNIDGKFLSTEERLTLYRIVQESVTNAVKHAQCSEITIKYKLKKSKLIINVQDNGIGFNVDKIINNTDVLDKQYGLKGIFERAQTVGIDVNIKSKRNNGTIVLIEYKRKC